jgi:hypothetical protein
MEPGSRDDSARLRPEEIRVVGGYIIMNKQAIGRIKDCSVCLLTLALVAGAPIMVSLSVFLFF